MQKDEKWIPGYESIYSCDKEGNIFSYHQGDRRKVKLYLRPNGYLQTKLIKNRAGKSFLVHRLICLSYYGESKLEVNHINGIKNDNRLENLEYCSRSKNIKHAWANNLYRYNFKRRKFDSEKIEYIHSMHGKMSANSLAKEMGVGHSAICRIWRGITYAEHAK